MNKLNHLLVLGASMFIFSEASQADTLTVIFKNPYTDPSVTMNVSNNTDSSSYNVQCIAGGCVTLDGGQSVTFSGTPNDSIGYPEMNITFTYPVYTKTCPSGTGTQYMSYLTEDTITSNPVTVTISQFPVPDGIIVNSAIECSSPALK